jgi:ketosteroid isomerase-like protein
MKKTLFLLTLLFVGNFCIAKSNKSLEEITESTDSIRISELDAFYIELARTVQEGDFEGYGATYHEDAVVVFAGDKNKVSYPISKALSNWKQGFIDTKEGKQNDNVEFRFSQRVGDETTAHDTGIFHFTSKNKSGEVLRDSFVHFEMLLVKKENTWLAVMEYQKSAATTDDWVALK